MTDVDWFVMIAALGVASAEVSWYGYRRRRLVLSAADLEFAVVDPLSAAGFARYCAALVRLLGYQRVRRARGGGVSLTATAPDGTLVAIRCARQKEPVAADAVRALSQGITGGRTGILLTNALVTPQARALAGDTGITLADRAVLRHWMELARASGPGGTPAADAAPAGAIARARTFAQARAVDGLVMGSVVGCAALVLIAVVIHAATGTAAPRITAPSVAAPSAAASATPVLGSSAASVAAVNAPALTPAGTTSPGNPGRTRGAAGNGDAASRDRHVLHVKHVLHVEHMSHVEYVEHHAPGQQG
jgi:hypothetical protein